MGSPPIGAMGARWKGALRGVMRTMARVGFFHKFFFRPWSRHPGKFIQEWILEEEIESVDIRLPPPRAWRPISSCEFRGGPRRVD